MLRFNFVAHYRAHQLVEIAAWVGAGWVTLRGTWKLRENDR